MALRLKSQWHKEDSERTLTEIGGAIAFNAWRLGMDKAVTLHSKHFTYRDDEQRLAVIAEYLIFQALAVERMTASPLTDDERRELVTAIVLKMADHFEENSQALLGAGDYRSKFISIFNQRASEYAEHGYTDEGPTYPFLRHLGYEIQQTMGESQENRWVIDQVMDIDAPELIKQLTRIVKNLFV
ncbi:MAG: hypothetical protein OQL27_11395 [Sedimenticola sp.]|nr:hypothetical protein [Sedimenticola sp.]